jgi:hypothetical protein
MKVNHELLASDLSVSLWLEMDIKLRPSSKGRIDENLRTLTARNGYGIIRPIVKGDDREE